MLSRRKRFAWFTASGETSSNFNSAAHWDMVAVTVGLAAASAGAGAMALDIRSSLFRQILEWQERHEVGVMHDVRFGSALDQVALGGMRCDDVTNRVGHAALHRQRNSGERVAQHLTALALARLAVDILVLQQLAYIGQNCTRNDGV